MKHKTVRATSHIITILSAALILGACTSPKTTSTSPSNTMDQAMNAEISTTQPYVNPKLNAKQALQAVLRLIDDLKDFDDLSLAQIQKSTGILLNEPSRDETLNDISFVERLSENFFSHMELLSKNNRVAFEFSFGRLKEDVAHTEVCEMDLDQFHAALINMGYQHKSSIRNNMLGRQYQRGNVRVAIRYGGESNESHEKIIHDCIRSIDIVKGLVQS